MRTQLVERLLNDRPSAALSAEAAKEIDRLTDENARLQYKYAPLWQAILPTAETARQLLRIITNSNIQFHKGAEHLSGPFTRRRDLLEKQLEELDRVIRS